MAAFRCDGTPPDEGRCFSQWFVLEPGHPKARCAAPHRTISGTTWLIDVHHGFQRRWDQIFHFSNTIFAAYDAAESGQLEPIDAAALYQIDSEAALHRAGDWFVQTLRIALHRLARGRGVRLLFGANFSGAPLCFERLWLVQRRLSQPHFHSVAAARAFRRRALSLSIPPIVPPEAAGATASLFATLLLRTDERLFLNAATLEGEMRTELSSPPISTRGAALPLRAIALRGSLTFRWQLELFASTKLLVTPHGAQLTNVVFMPAGASVVETFNCGFFSDVPKKLALECGLRYVATQDPRPGCDAIIGKRHQDDDRNVTIEELRPALRAALLG